MYNEEMKDFVLKVFEKSGISPDATFLPPTINPCVAKVRAGAASFRAGGGWSAARSDLLHGCRSTVPQ
jgi:hypothetical protein